MKSTLTLAFAFIVSFVLASLIYMSDPDVEGIQDLNSFGAILFIFLLSFFPFAFMVIILKVTRVFGTKVGLMTLLLVACAASYFIMMVSHPSLSLSQQLETMAKSSSFMIGVFAFGALPHWLIVIRKNELHAS